MDRFNIREELLFYKNYIENDLLPYWERHLDHKYGGVYTCISNDGKRLINTDKFIWSQGRFLWVLAKSADLIKKGILSGDSELYLEFAHKTYCFVKKNAFLENGGCAYLVTENGEKRESLPGKGYHISLFVDGFVTSGFAEYARVSGNLEALEDSLNLFDFIEKVIASGSIPSEPFPTPDGYATQSIVMIMTNVSYVLAIALEELKHPRAKEILEKSAAYAKQVLTKFCREDYSIREFVKVGGAENDTLLERHTLPGHGMECMWFVIFTALKIQDHEMIEKASKIVAKSFELGWDDEFGGLLRYVDKDGGKPRGQELGGQYELLIKNTWDSKIWWTHSETLFSTLLCYFLTKDNKFMTLYEKVRDYIFKMFPNPDKSVGEWIQILGRQGRPEEKLVALPVKDPYHILRNIQLLVELLNNIK